MPFSREIESPADGRALLFLKLMLAAASRVGCGKVGRIGILCGAITKAKTNTKYAKGNAKYAMGVCGVRMLLLAFPLPISPRPGPNTPSELKYERQVRSEIPGLFAALVVEFDFEKRFFPLPR
jgi:hypothetical protein